jgi:hypothetical protein
VGSIILVALIAHHTPTLTYVIAPWGLTWETVILRFHIFTELKWSLTAKQGGCGIYLSIMQSTKVPVPKIQSRFITCVIELMNHSCLKWMQYKLYFCTFSCCLEWKLLIRNLLCICEYLFEFMQHFLQHLCCAYVPCKMSVATDRWPCDKHRER